MFSLSNLSLTEPQTREQAVAVLGRIGDAVWDIKEGLPFAFEDLRTDLIEKAGLESVGRMNDTLKNCVKSAESVSVQNRAGSLKVD